MYNLHQYKNKKNNKIFRYTLIVLNIVLVILITYIVIKSHINNTKSTEAFKQQKLVQLKANNQVQDWQMKALMLKDELQRTNEIIVLEGRREIRCDYSTTKDEVKYQGNDSRIKFLLGKLNELKTKSISVQTQYNYIFTYDLSDLDVEIANNKLKITLQRGKINLKPLAEVTKERIIGDKSRILSGSFNPQQIGSIMHMATIHTFNTINSDNGLYATALMNAKTNIEELANKFGIKDIEFQILNTETIEREDVVVLN